MPSLNLDLDYFTHRKARRITGLLGPEAAIYPLRLWCYVGKHHPVTGVLAGYSREEIETIVEWRGEKDVCIDALLKIKFLIEKKENFAVNDWLEHAGHLAAYKKRAKLAAKIRWKGHATSNPSSNAKPETTNAPTSHLRALHSEAKQNRREDQTFAVPAKSAELPDDASWLSELQASPAYKHLNIRMQLEKCRVWCKTNKKTLSRKRFINWLNRTEAPLNLSNGSGCEAMVLKPGYPSAKKCGEPVYVPAQGEKLSRKNFCQPCYKRWCEVNP